MIFYIAAFLGVLAHFILKWRDAWTKEEPFNYKYHGIIGAFSLFLALILIFFKEDINGMLGDGYQITWNPLMCFFIGYFSDSVFKNLESFAAKRLKTDASE
jgi:amino acid transporter